MLMIFVTGFLVVGIALILGHIFEKCAKAFDEFFSLADDEKEKD